MNNNLTNDEEYLFNVFSNLMNQIGYGNMFSLEKPINNGYSLYKEDDRWILFKEENGFVDTYNRYTNLYNLCFDIIKKLDDNKKDFCSRIFLSNIIIPRGTEVLIFNRINGFKLDEIEFIKGRIISKKVMNDKWIHGSTFNDDIYIVEGEDGECYIGRYGNSINGYFFKTVEDYISHIADVIENNNKKINELKNDNKTYRKLLSDIIIKNNDNYLKKN